jgi:putative methanogenesis marker 13 metalloprotein
MDIHAGFRENIDGVMAALRPAADIGWISVDELSRQERILAGANAVERARGAACKPYIQPSRGDLKHVAAEALLACIRAGKKGMVIMNAKKETAFMFADILLAVHEAAPEADIEYYANVSDLGLAKVRRDAALIRDGLKAQGIDLIIIGALDEYGVLGDVFGEIIQKEKPDFAVIVGVPHAIPPEYTQGVEVFSVTNGPRQVEPLRDLGHQHVVVEVDLHPKTLGVHEIIPSEFGETIRSLL